MRHCWGTINPPNRPRRHNASVLLRWLGRSSSTTPTHLQRLPPHRDLSDDQHAVSVHNVPSRPALKPQPPHLTTPRSNRSPPRPKHPISDTFCRSGLHFEQPAGDFATIDHRHAGDTPPHTSYGRNSPQAASEGEPQHQDKQAKTRRRQPTPQHQEHDSKNMPRVGSTTPVREHHTTY